MAVTVVACGGGGGHTAVPTVGQDTRWRWRRAAKVGQLHGGDGGGRAVAVAVAHGGGARWPYIGGGGGGRDTGGPVHGGGGGQASKRRDTCGCHAGRVGGSRPHGRVRGKGNPRAQGRSEDRDKCRYCGISNHWARDCRKKKREEAHLVRGGANNDALLMM
ncbi:hypothetical protein QYE76_019197 [Lolium multiflorum]|uniref:CCHC-type domain-containing protein n=1 Tax=Lolium multiflorum TaxID=4521 RepID=A0AAD8R2G7_LOLMU|nr:hypothetical protein QYE76_019197 [Lolium multiflorum]